MIPIPNLEAIEDFLAQKRIAMIGIPRNPKDFSAALFQELQRRGYDMVPVNPNASKIMGRPCFSRIQEVQPPVNAALLMTTPEVTDAVVRDCDAAGIRQIWIYRAGGKGAVSEKALAFCREHGIQVVPGQCPFMFLPGLGACTNSTDGSEKSSGHIPNTSTLPKLPHLLRTTHPVFAICEDRIGSLTFCGGDFGIPQI